MKVQADEKRKAQELRRNATKQENHLWYDFLKPTLKDVHRQKTFGNYIVDFYIASAGLVVEVDGSQHYGADGLSDYDQQRDAWLEKEHGLRVVHVTNHEVDTNFRGVCEMILHIAQARRAGRSTRNQLPPPGFE